MTKQFCGDNPILHINLLLQICLKLQVMKNKASLFTFLSELNLKKKGGFHGTMV